MVDPFLELPVPRPSLQSVLADNPDGILERVAKEYGVTSLEVVCALPVEHCATALPDKFEEVMSDLTDWGNVLVIVHTDNIVLECKGAVPPGSYGRGYFNLHGESPIGGHIKVDRLKCIAFVSRPFMGRQSCSVQFFDQDGDAMFKVFVGRDSKRELMPEQVSRFQALRAKVCR